MTLRTTLLLWLLCVLPLVYVAGWVSHVVYRAEWPVGQCVVRPADEVGRGLKHECPTQGD